MLPQVDQRARKDWTILRIALKKFSRIDGAQWAGAFAFHVFFSLFPLMVLVVSIASFVVDRETAGKEVVTLIERTVPISGEMQHRIFGTIAGIVDARGRASAAASLILAWAALQCFSTIISATNRAWGTEVSNWWRIPLKSLVLLGITLGAVLLGIALPMLMRMAKHLFFPVNDLGPTIDAWAGYIVPLVVVFLSLSLFYKLAPRAPKRFADVWAAALCATALLLAAESLFVVYLKNFASFNAVYGAFGGIMALLLWIYVSGCVFIFGACLCAARAERRLALP